MIIHFGINPDSGGRPPIESRVAIIRLVMMGILFHVWDRDKVVVAELWINSMNIASVVVM